MFDSLTSANVGKSLRAQSQGHQGEMPILRLYRENFSNLKWILFCNYRTVYRRERAVSIGAAKLVANFFPELIGLECKEQSQV